MLVSANDGRVDEQLFHVGIAAQHVGHPLPEAAVAPTGKANVCAVPVAQLAGQVSPRTAGTQYPEDRLDEETVVLRRAAWIAGLAWQKVFNTRPLVISQHLPVHPDSAEKSGYDHIQTAVNSPSPCH